MKRYKIAVVGATGAVGQELLSILEKRSFPVSDFIPFASPRSEGTEVRLGALSAKCQVLRPGCFKGVDIAFFDASDAVSLEWVPQAAEAGAWVIDNSATYRMESDVPLLVPEINGALIRARAAKGAKATPRERILSGPNCSTVQMALALKPLRDRWGLKRVVVSTYQSASGAGAAAVTELSEQIRTVFDRKPVQPKAFAHQLAFNCIPHIGGAKESGYTSEEEKMIQESRKILDLPKLRITATAVRVPTRSCHAESLNVECERPFEIAEVRRALADHPGIVLQDDLAKKVYPMGMGGAEPGTGRDAVYVGRVRRDESVENGLNLWVVSDNLRKGAALNAVQIGETLLQSL